MGRSAAGWNLLKRLESIPEAIRSPFLLVLLLQAGLFVAGPLPNLTRFGPLILSAAACFMLGLSVHASDCGRGMKRLGWLAATVLFVANQIGGAVDGRAAGIMLHLLFPLLVTTACVLVLRTVLRSKEVGVEQIYAGISFYLMLGILWANAYVLLDWLDLTPAAFSRDLVPGGPPGALLGGQYAELLYFSYITLATVGYGDIYPTHPITRNLAAFEAVAGQIYVAVLLARLVTLHGTRGRPRE